MKHSARFTFAAALLSVFPTLLSANAVADENSLSGGTPLMVIRFNQAHVDYPMPLYNTMSRALEAKPSAKFDVVSVAPRAKDAQNQAYYDRMAAQNTKKVLSTIHEIGMPDSRVNLTTATDTVEASEVRIYVH